MILLYFRPDEATLWLSGGRWVVFFEESIELAGKTSGVNEPTHRSATELHSVSSADDALDPEQLFELALVVLERRARQMLRTFPSVRRWEQTDDICQTVAMQLWQVFRKGPPDSMRHFYKYASRRIRWCLLSLARKHAGPQGLTRNLESWDEATLPLANLAAAHPDDSPVSLCTWAEFHTKAGDLPGLTGEVFNMMWYFGVPAQRVARTLDVGEATVRRHWRLARIELAKTIDRI